MSNNEFTCLLIFFMKFTHPGTKSKTRTRTLPTFQKIPSSLKPLPETTLLFRGNFSEYHPVSEHYSNVLLQHVSFMCDYKIMIITSSHVVAGSCHLFFFISISIV